MKFYSRYFYDACFLGVVMFGWSNKKVVPATSNAPRVETAGSYAGQKLKLIDVIKKQNVTQLGPFEDLNRDLANYIEKNHETCEPMVKMAYAYARRAAMAGLYFQGIVGENVVSHVEDIFVALQKVTGQTIEFQREAANQATDVLKSYVPRLAREHEKALLYFAREGIGAVELADSHEYLAIDEIEDDPVSIEKCLDLLDYVLHTDDVLREAFSPSQKPSTRLRLIDVVDKVSSTKLGAFGNMCEDMRASAPKYVSDNLLWAASGYAFVLGACAIYVGGGVHPKIVQDACSMSDDMMGNISGNQAVLQACKEQAVALAMTYSTRMTKEAAEVIVEFGLKFESFADSSEARPSPEEVVLRARRIVRDRGI